MEAIVAVVAAMAPETSIDVRLSTMLPIERVIGMSRFDSEMMAIETATTRIKMGQVGEMRRARNDGPATGAGGA